MQDIVENQLLSEEQLQVLSERIRKLVEIRTGQRRRRSPSESDNEDERPRKRRADHDLKYENIEKLKLGASLKA
jgi:hypothetical protein